MHHRKHARAGKRQCSRGCFVEDTSKREKVRTAIKSLSASLLRRHVGGGAKHSAFISQVCKRGSVVINAGCNRVNGLCKTKIKHLNATTGTNQNLSLIHISEP